MVILLIITVEPSIAWTSGTIVTIPVILIPISPIAVAAVTSISITATLKKSTLHCHGQLELKSKYKIKCNHYTDKG